jgi:hypothetical protein
MLVSDAFPSNYIRAADLKDRQVTVTMSHVNMEDIGGDHKPVLYFKGKEKGLVLNKTNSTNIAMIYGDDTDGWEGGEVILFPTMVDFQGKSVAAVRIKVPPRPAARREPPPAPPPATDDPMDIPF